MGGFWGERQASAFTLDVYGYVTDQRKQAGESICNALVSARKGKTSPPAKRKPWETAVFSHFSG